MSDENIQEEQAQPQSEVVAPVLDGQPEAQEGQNPETPETQAPVETPEPLVAPEVTGTLPVVDSSAPVEVYFDGAKVLEVLGDGPTPGQKSCKMDDGTTKHVPVELLN